MSFWIKASEKRRLTLYETRIENDQKKSKQPHRHVICLPLRPWWPFTHALLPLVCHTYKYIRTEQQLRIRAHTTVLGSLWTSRRYRSERWSGSDTEQRDSQQVQYLWYSKSALLITLFMLKIIAEYTFSRCTPHFTSKLNVVLAASGLNLFIIKWLQIQFNIKKYSFCKLCTYRRKGNSG